MWVPSLTTCHGTIPSISLSRSGQYPGETAIQCAVPNVTAIAYYESVGVGSYNSLQTSFQQQLSRGFFLTANYVWAHALDNAPYDGGVNGPIPQNPSNRTADYASPDNDIQIA